MDDYSLQYKSGNRLCGWRVECDAAEYARVELASSGAVVCVEGEKERGGRVVVRLSPTA